MQVPKYEYLFHRFIRKFHGLITGNPVKEEEEAEDVLSPYSKPLRKCLDELGSLEQVIYNNVRDYQDCLDMIKLLIDAEIKDIEELKQNPELDSLDIKLTSRIGLYKGLRIILNRYCLNAERFLDFIREQAPESFDELNELVDKYAEEVERGKNPPE